MTVRELRDALTTVMQREDGETPIGDLAVTLAVYDPSIGDVQTGDPDPNGELYTYDGELFILHGVVPERLRQNPHHDERT